MSIVYEIESITSSRNTIRNKMVAAGQATMNDKLETLASNLEIIDTSDATATEDDISEGKTAYVQGVKLTGTRTTTSDIFVAEYGVTTYSEINAAYTAGKFILVQRSLNGISLYAISCKTSDGTFYFRTFSNSVNTNYGCYINSAGTWAVNSYAYAALSSPTFTGTPKAPTATAGTNTTQIATTAFVKTAIDNAITSALAASY